jgi:hypothetical protein
MIRLINNLIIRLVTVSLLLLLLPAVAYSGSNPLTKHSYDSATGIGYFDLVVSLNWQPDQADRDGRLKNSFQQFAKDVFMMSEGKQKLRKLYVFTDSDQMNTADIRFLNVGGRSNANSGGILHSGARILTYTGFSSGSARTDAYIGHTMAHEFGHYAYTLYDEYRGSASSSTWPGKPLSGDNPRPTIMNQQGTYQWFSVDTDYDTAAEKVTAQWRVYQASAWETLVKSPTSDKTPNDFIPTYPRVRYSEFDGFALPTVLTKPSTGWDSDFEIIYVNGSVAVLVIDDSGSMGFAPPAMPIAISAAKQYVDLMEFGEKVAVVGFDDTARIEIGVTELKVQADKDAVKAAIDGLIADGGTSFSAALSVAQSILTSASSASENRYVVMMSDGLASTPSTTFYQQNSIPIYTIGLGAGVNPSVLTAIASATGGTYTPSPTAADLANVYAQVRRDIGGNEQLVGQNEAEIAAGASQSWTTLISSQDGTVKFSLNWAAGDTMTLTLERPDGLTITPTSLPTGVTYTSGDTYAIFRVDSPAAGNWISTATSSSVAAGNVTHEVSADSTLGVSVTTLGGVYPEPIAILASVTAPESVIGATVVAEITPPAGAPAITPIALRDDGIKPDRILNDGVYTGALANYAANGDYNIRVVVSNPSATAQLYTAGALEDGVDAAPVTLPSFNRAVAAIVTASNVSPLPADATSAQLITADNTITWGAVAQDEDEIWYRFNAVANTAYFLQTSNLISWDATTMATTLVLYDTDTTTVLASSSHYNGGDVSFIEWQAPADGTYYVKVAHASPGTGSYGLTVGETSLYTTAFTTTSTSAPAAGGGGGGGSMSWLPGLVFVVLFMGRRKLQAIA